MYISRLQTFPYCVNVSIEQKLNYRQNSLNYGVFIIAGDLKAITDTKAMKDSCN